MIDGTDGGATIQVEQNQTDVLLRGRACRREKQHGYPSGAKSVANAAAPRAIRVRKAKPRLKSLDGLFAALPAFDPPAWTSASCSRPS
jgi:hypothetical protein